jgi:class 3 adenylate cyclase/CHASE2 domain-containing sensor protein
MLQVMVPVQKTMAPAAKSLRARASHDVRNTVLLVVVGLFASLSLQTHVAPILEIANTFVWRLQLPFRAPPKPTGVVTIAAIDDATVARYGEMNMTRLLADAVNALHEYRVRVIGILPIIEHDSPVRGLGRRDYQASDNLSSSAENDQNALVLALRSHGTVYLGCTYIVGSSSAYVVDSAHQKNQAIAYKVNLGPAPGELARKLLLISRADPPLELGNYFGPRPSLAQASRGTAIVVVGRDATLPEIPVIPLATRVGQDYRTPFAVALVSGYLGGSKPLLILADQRVSRIEIGKIKVSEPNRSAFMFVELRGPVQPIPHYSVADIIEHKISRNALEDRIVVIGITARGTEPAQTHADAESWVDVHASGVDQILSGIGFVFSDYNHELPRLLILALAMIGLSALTASASAAAAPWLTLAGITLIFVVGFAETTFELAAHGTLVPWGADTTGLLLPYAGVMTIAMVRRRRERLRIRQAFEHYLDPKIVDTAINDPAGLELGGQRRQLSILFADIVNFTARAEASEPEQLVTLLNDFMSTMTEVVIRSGGVVDKLLGDGVMAFWGAPVAIENSARATVDCALDMLVEVDRLRATDQRFADFDIGIGIATGEAVVGNFGGLRRFDYSVVGDAVNLASRLERLTRHFRVRLAVNERTWREAGDGYVARELGAARVKGKTEIVSVFEIVDRKRDGIDDSYYARFSEALAASRSQAPVEARARFAVLAAERPDDHVVQLYMERLQFASASDLSSPIFEFGTT